MSEPALRRAIADACRHLYERGHNAPFDGNVSARLGDRYLLTTPTQRHKGRLSPADIVKVVLDDLRPVDGAPSSELRMHRAIYLTRPDVRAIVHAHSPSTVALTVAGRDLSRPVVPEAIQTLGSVPTVPYASPTTADVAEAVIPFACGHDAFVLERHGPVALGRDLDEALVRLEVIEHTAKITIQALAAGGAEPIDDEEAARLLALAGRAVPGDLGRPMRARGGTREVDRRNLSAGAVSSVARRS